MSDERKQLLDKIVADLRGTCQDIDEVADYHSAGELTIDDLEYIETWVFLCEGCGWWCDVGEMRENEDGEHVCEDCV